MVELTAFSALSLAPSAGVSWRREARESDLTSTEPPLCRRGETAHDYASPRPADANGLPGDWGRGIVGAAARWLLGNGLRC